MPLSSGITFARQGQSGVIGQVTLVTNGTAAERTANIDSILTGMAIQPGATWTIQNTNIATLSGSGSHPLWHEYNPPRPVWVATNPGWPLAVRSNTLGAYHSNIIHDHPSGTQTTGFRRRLGTPWMNVSSPAGNGYSHSGYLSFAGPSIYTRYAPNYLSDTSRATRTITAVNPGTTTLQVRIPPTATTGAIYGTLVVNVQTRVTGISISPTTSTDLVIHEPFRPTQQFTATLTPTNANVGRTITWVSSNPAVATVNSSGLVQTVGPGYTYITGTANGITSTPRRVNVTSLVSSLTMCRPNVRLTIDGNIYEQTELNVTVNPSNATNPNVTWSSSDENIATVDGGRKRNSSFAWYCINNNNIYRWNKCNCN